MRADGKTIIWRSFLAGLLLALAAWLSWPRALTAAAESVPLYPDSLIYAVRYEETDGRYVPSGVDPQLGFLFGGREISQVRLGFSSALEQDTPVQVFYAAEEGDFSQESSVTVLAPAGSAEAVLALPEPARCAQLRVDIDGPFSLEGVTADSVRMVPGAGMRFGLLLLFILVFWALSALACLLWERRIPAAVREGVERLCRTASGRRFDGACLLLQLFFSSCILQQICFSVLGTPPLIPLACGFLLLAAQLAAGSAGAKRAVLSSFLVCLLTAALFRLSGLGGQTRRLLYPALTALVWLGCPGIFARSLAADCVRRGWDGLRRRWRIGACAALAALLGALAEFLLSRQAAEPMLWRRGALFAAMIFAGACFCWRRKMLLEKAENMFLLLCLSMGLFLSVCMPIASNVSWDDQIHYKHSLFLTQNVQTEYTGADSLIVRLGVDSTLSQDQERRYVQALDWADEDVGSEIDTGVHMFIPSAIGNLPAAVGMWAARILRLDYFGVFVLGRAGSLAFYALCLYFAIKRLKNGKILAMCVGLIPTGVFLAANYSYDPWVVGLSALSFCYFWSALQRPGEKLTVWEAVIMVGGLFFGLLPKSVYFPLFILLFMMPKEKFADGRARKRYLWAIVVCIGLEMAYIVLSELFLGVMTDARGGESVDGPRQIVYILTHPLTYAGTLLRFLASYLDPANATQYVSYFAYLGAGTAYGAVLALILAAALTDCGGRETLCRKMGHRALSLAVVLGMAALVATTFYISFTPVGEAGIYGCSPRYILPLVLPFFAFVLFGNVRLRLRRTYYNALFYLGSFCCLCFTVWQIYAVKLTA